MANNNNKKKEERIGTRITKSILGGTFSATAWVFSFLIEMGTMTMSAFLSPSIYADFPNTSLVFNGDNFPKNKRSKFKEINIRQSIRRLQKHGFVEKSGNNYFLTQKGKHLANYIMKIKKVAVEKWDGKYRVVIFDIPEEKSAVRDWLRRELYLLKYKKLQKSVFIGKHPLTGDLIKNIKRNKIGNFVNYLLVEKAYKNIF